MRRICTGLTIFAVASCLLLQQNVYAGGFEVGENTTLSLARGLTGAVGKRDPSALYFNPALLSDLRGFQFLLNANLVDLTVEFQRDDITWERRGEESSQSFDPARNTAGPFPAPFLALSWDFGLEDFAVGLGVFGPSAYGRTCTGRMESGECLVEEDNAARMMLVESRLLEIYFTLGAGYAFDWMGGRLQLGLAGMLAWQSTNFTTVVDEVWETGPPWDEDFERQGVFRATNLRDINPNGIIGLVWERNGFRLGASYRAPFYWDAEGDMELEVPETIAPFVELENNRVAFRTWQAGSLRAGWGYQGGTHPADARRPRIDVEVNIVWEDWSRVEDFDIEPLGGVLVAGARQPLFPIRQTKNWKDTYSLRTGVSYGANTWSTMHAGIALETAAQDVQDTHMDFVSWDRYTFGLGFSFHLLDWLDLDLGYAFIYSPPREVIDGRVYPAIPLSPCRAPDFDHEACEAPGVPPGNVLNEGSWRSYFQIASAGVTLRL